MFMSQVSSSSSELELFQSVEFRHDELKGAKIQNKKDYLENEQVTEILKAQIHLKKLTEDYVDEHKSKVDMSEYQMYHW